MRLPNQVSVFNLADSQYRGLYFGCTIQVGERRKRENPRPQSNPIRSEPCGESQESGFFLKLPGRFQGAAKDENLCITGSEYHPSV